MKFNCPSIQGERNNAVVSQCNPLTVDDLMLLVVDFKRKVDEEIEESEYVNIHVARKSCYPDPRHAELRTLIRQSLALMHIVEEGSLKYYFIHSEDIRQCPGVDCDFSGFVEVEKNGTIGCTNNFECPKCDNQWRDPL